MAKEAELKKIELKVSVDCCDGCKKKVRKLLQTVEGVLKTDIHVSQPKITVLGNVDPQVLIKKLARIGKQAEIWTQPGSKNNQKEKIEKETPATKENETCKTVSDEPVKCRKSTNKPAEKMKKATPSADEGKEKASKKNGETNRNNNDNNNKSSYMTSSNSETPMPSKPPEFNDVMYPGVLQGFPKTGAQCFYFVEPPHPIGMPYYAACSYVAPLPPATSYGQEYCSYDRRLMQMEFQAPLTRVGDYFNDDNTVGCHVM